MTDIHIDDFYKDVATILLRLYNSFPRKIILYVEDVAGQDQPDEFGLHSERFLAGFSTMLWLADHGYLKFEVPIRQEALDQAVLTERGFLMLSSRSSIGDKPSDDISLPLSALENSLTNVTQLRKALKNRSSAQIKHCVHAMLWNTHGRNG